MRNARMMLVAAMLVAWTLSASAKDAPKTAEELLSRFEVAFKAKDAKAIGELICWDGVSDQMRSMQMDGFKPMFQYTVDTIKLAPLPAGFKSTFEHSGVRYRTSVEVVGMIDVQYTAKGNATQMPYGKKDGAFYITSTVEEKGSAEK